MLERVNIDTRGRVRIATIRATDELDVYSLPDIKDKVMGALDDQPEIFVLDISCVRSVDSSGVGLMIGLHRRVNAYDGLFCIAGPGDQVQSVLDHSLLSKRLSLFPDSESAVRFALEQNPN